jgi:predicted N-acyltransferase
MSLQLERVASLLHIGPAAWNVLAHDSPFLRHEFLSALERSGCVGPGTAWEPCYLLAKDGGELLGALPLFLKYDSRGEFVFDWGWADAYERSGRSYYPKLVASIPFTPATGQRLLFRPGADAAAVSDVLIRGARAAAAELDASSLHFLFPTDTERELLDREGFLTRKSCQFHWHNDGYADFDDFLGRFSSMKRKKAKRERRRVAEAQIAFEHLRGDEPTRAEWDAIFQFYSHTFERRGRPPYLNREFFAQVATTMPENLVIVLARYRGAPIAAAICFRGGGTLYGRYWGSLADFHSLHFETCYYQGIEYCIRERLQKFEPGTQGEHKISRGFTPSATWSCHWLRDPDFHGAVADFLRRETRHVDAYMDELDEHVPYRDAAPAPPLGSPGDRSEYPVREPPG